MSRVRPEDIHKYLIVHGDTLHVDISRMLKAWGFDDCAENRELLTQVAKDVFRQEFGADVEINVTWVPR
jgi:hypothetical protein